MRASTTCCADKPAFLTRCDGSREAVCGAHAGASPQHYVAAARHRELRTQLLRNALAAPRQLAFETDKSSMPAFQDAASESSQAMRAHSCTLMMRATSRSILPTIATSSIKDRAWPKRTYA